MALSRMAIAGVARNSVCIIGQTVPHGLAVPSANFRLRPAAVAS
jgi:hypothetical protein